MKKTLYILFVCTSLTSIAQKEIDKKDWQSDLRFLQETVHESFPFLFKKIEASDFDKKVEKLYNEIPTMQEHEIVVGFAKIVSSFQYGHTSLSFRSSPVDFHTLPIQIYEFKDGVYVTGAHKDYPNIVGAKLIAIEGKSTKEVFKAIYPTVPAENDYYFKAYGISNALIPEVLHAQKITNELQQEILLTVELNNKPFVIKVKAQKDKRFPLQYGEVKPNSDWISARDLAKTPLYLQHLEKRYFFEYLSDKKALYIRYSAVLDDKTERVSTFFKRVFEFVENNKIEKFILDIRLNGGGNNFNNKQVITNIIEHKKINQKGKLFAIIGRRTFSAAQNLVNELSNYTNVTFLGEPTAENINFYGDAKRIRLPKSGLNAYLSWAWWQDKPQWANDEYTRPNVLVKMTFDQYKNNEDPVLERILGSDK